MKRLVFALAFVCALLVAALVVVMMYESRLAEQNAELVKKLEEKMTLTVDVDVRGRYIFATAQNGYGTVETIRHISDWGLYRKIEIE